MLRALAANARPLRARAAVTCRSPWVTRWASSKPQTQTQAEGATRREELLEKSKSHAGRLKELWGKYGAVAIGTYLGMYGAVLGSIYVAIDQGWLKTKKTSRGAGADDSDEFNLVTTTNRCVSSHLAI